MSGVAGWSGRKILAFTVAGVVLSVGVLVFL